LTSTRFNGIGPSRAGVVRSVALFSGLTLCLVAACTSTTGPTDDGSLTTSAVAGSVPAGSTVSSPTDTTPSSATGSSAAPQVTFVLTAVEQATPTLLAQSVTVFEKRLADIAGSSVVILGDRRLQVSGPASATARIKANLDSGQLNFRPVINLAPGAPATTSASSSEGAGSTPGADLIPVQPAGTGAADWLSTVARDLPDLGCDRLEPHDGPSDPERQLLTCDQEHATLYLLDSAIIEGTEIESAKAEKDATTGQWTVQMLLDESGLKKWSAHTAANIGSQVAFVLNSEVVSAPTIQAEITNAATSITGGFDEDTATALANGLNAGALPLSFTVAAG